MRGRGRFLRIAGCCLVLFTLFWLLFIAPEPVHVVTDEAVTDSLVIATRPKEPEQTFTGTSTSFRRQTFFLRATYSPSDDDVTLCVQLTTDRLTRLVHVIRNWQGPMSVSFYIKNEAELQKIRSFVSTRADLVQFMDAHLLYANNTRYPVNSLRNFAIESARTSLVCLLDVDFDTNPNAHELMKADLKQYLRDMEGLSVFVIPAFQSDLKSERLPMTKRELIEAVQAKQVLPVNEDRCPKCHSPTNYRHWYTADKPYRADYRWIYEPYIAFRRTQNFPLYSERLQGYGFDKNTHAFYLAVSGRSFIVLPHHWAVHINHPDMGWDGPPQRTQQWEALKIVCDLLIQYKEEFKYPTNSRLFDEPLPGNECMSDSHW